MKVFYDSDAQPELLRDKVIAIAGYGSQGHAQAQNLRDSGFQVIVALEPDANRRGRLPPMVLRCCPWRWRRNART